MAKAPPGAPTVLVYGHYDVQPAEPLELWTSPPFEPTMRDGRIYARGSVDDKGQLFVHVKALEAHLERARHAAREHHRARRGRGGGRQRQSRGVRRRRTRSGSPATAVVISDSSMFAPGLPSILSSLRGLAYFQIDVQGPASDLHSGSYGGAVVNPAMALARILATFFDDERARRHSRLLRQGARVGPNDSRADQRRSRSTTATSEEVGAPALGGEKGYSTLERLWSRPTCEVNGLLSGYTGEGAKTVLPAKAMAKVSCRLVADQTPAEIEQAHAARTLRAWRRAA